MTEHMENNFSLSGGTGYTILCSNGETILIFLDEGKNVTTETKEDHYSKRGVPVDFSAFISSGVSGFVVRNNTND